eukprot:3558037-Pleurochrysis_carterae.AAC.1
MKSETDIDTSKHHHYPRIIQILTASLVGAPILDGAFSGVTTGLQFSRPDQASPTGLLGHCSQLHKTAGSEQNL